MLCDGFEIGIEEGTETIFPWGELFEYDDGANVFAEEGCPG